MKLIIAGSRHLDLLPIEMINWCVNNFPIDQLDEVVCGKAKGIDTSGENFAKEYGIDVKAFPADWNKYGKKAGPIRNKQMADYADALLLIWDGKSSGSKNMKEEMEKLGKPVFEYIIRMVL